MSRFAARSSITIDRIAAVGIARIAPTTISVKPKPPAGGPVPAFAEVRAIVDRHCVMCHAATPTHRGVPTAPNRAAFDTDEGLRRHAAKIYERAVATHAMPQGDETHITDLERAKLGAWIKAGAKVGG